MGIFSKNPNESAYVGGKKHFADVIKNLGPGNLLIWKCPEEDFNTNSTLIVNPGEQAIFVDNGQIVQVFPNGRYRLSTENYPFISRLRNAFTGGISSFNCFVYFVRDADSEELKWGTDSPIAVRDKVWGILTNVRARAVYKIKIKNPSMLLQKLIGSNVNFETQQGLYKYFNGEFTGKIKSAVSKDLQSIQTELIGLDARMDELSEQIKPSISKILGDYGMECIAFQLVALDVDQSKYDAVDVSQIGRINMQRTALGQKDTMDILGDDWSRQQSVDILKGVANNKGGAGMIAGVGLGVNSQNAIGDLAKEITKPAENKKEVESTSTQAKNPKEVLQSAKELLDSGLISQEEYDAMKKKVISEMMKGM